MSCALYNTFTWGGVTFTPISDGALVIAEWTPELKQQERHIVGSGRTQRPTFGYVWRWSGRVLLSSESDYGTVLAAFLAGTSSTWNDGTRSYDGVLITNLSLLPIFDTSAGRVGNVTFLRAEG